MSGHCFSSKRSGVFPASPATLSSGGRGISDLTDTVRLGIVGRSGRTRPRRFLLRTYRLSISRTTRQTKAGQKDPRAPQSPFVIDGDGYCAILAESEQKRDHYI